MAHYPLFIDLSSRRALVVGAGNVGRRKAGSLIAAGIDELTIVDPALAETPDLFPAGSARLCCLGRAFRPEDLQGKDLVFAAAGGKEANAEVIRLCREHGILCNSADSPDAGDFFVPAHFSHDGITVALSTGGRSPALARLLREELEAFIGNRYTPLLTIMGRLRPLILELELPAGRNSELFRLLVRSALPELLEHGNTADAAALLREHLPPQLHSRLGELLHGL